MIFNYTFKLATCLVLVYTWLAVVTCNPSAAAAGNSHEENDTAAVAAAAAALNDFIEQEESATSAAGSNSDKQLSSEQRGKFALSDALIDIYLRELVKNYKNLDSSSEESVAAAEQPQQTLTDDSESELLSEISKRARSVIKKDAPNLRTRQQAARWDIGFGKRAKSNSGKAFLDTFYGKRSGAKASPRASFGRRQQWDLQYGRK